MNTEQALNAHLLANGELTAIVGPEGVFPTGVPSVEDDLPCVVYSRESTDVDSCLGGGGLRTVVFVLACLSSTWDEAKAIAEAVAGSFPAGLASLGDSFPVESVSVGDVSDQGRDEAVPVFRIDVKIEVRDNNEEAL